LVNTLQGLSEFWKFALQFSYHILFLRWRLAAKGMSVRVLVMHLCMIKFVSTVSYKPLWEFTT